MSDDFLQQFTMHLEFLGYAIDGPDEHGWYNARHELRLVLFFRVTATGVRLHAPAWVGHRVALQRLKWLEFINRFNDEAQLARAALWQDGEGDDVVRMRALLPPVYDRVLFGRLLDLWHADQDLLRQWPEPPEALTTEAQEETIN
jgi:hypothetical protein